MIRELFLPLVCVAGRFVTFLRLMNQGTAKGRHGSGVNAQDTVCPATILRRPDPGQKSTREDRKHPLESAIFLETEVQVGLKSVN